MSLQVIGVWMTFRAFGGLGFRDLGFRVMFSLLVLKVQGFRARFQEFGAKNFHRPAESLGSLISA